MTRRNASQVFEEIEVMKEHLKRSQYSHATMVTEMRTLKQAVLASNAEVLNQLIDTQATLEYLKSYIGIDDFFEEAIRQGKGSETGRMIPLEQRDIRPKCDTNGDLLK